MVPIAVSSIDGFPTRKARSSKMYGTYSTDAAIAAANIQSYSGTPPGAAALGWCGCSSIALRSGKTRNTRPSTNARWTPRCVVSRRRPKPAV